MSKEKEYYNYIAFYRGIPVYVGKGKGSRWFHTLSGKSGSELINDFYFRNKYLLDMPLDTYKVAYFKTNEQATRNERRLIDKYLPYCNKCSGRGWEHDYYFSDKLKEVALNLGFSEPEKLSSKFDFRFLFTPKGLLCTRVELADTSPFERAEEPYHIRVKSDLFIHFPEFALQFAKFIPEIVELNMYDLGRSKRKIINDVERCNGVFSHVTDDDEWIIEAVNSGSLEFAEEFGYTYDGIDFVKRCYFKTIADAHVEAYNQHMKEIKKKAAKIERIIQEKEKNREKLMSMLKSNDVEVGLEHIDDKSVNRLLKIVQSSGFRIKAKPDVVEYLQQHGFNMVNPVNWLNIHTWKTPTSSIFVCSDYTLLKGLDDLKMLDLNRFNLKCD